LYKRRKYIITPTAVCTDSDQKFRIDLTADTLQYPHHAYKLIMERFDISGLGQPEINDIFQESVVLDMVKIPDENLKNDGIIFGIPEVKRFKWQEACLGVIKDKRADELGDNDKLALERFELLAKTIVSNRKK